MVPPVPSDFCCFEGITNVLTYFRVLQLLEVLEIYWNLISFLEILEIS